MLVIKEVNINTTRRYYFIPTRVATVQKKENNKNWPETELGKSSYITGRNASVAATLETSLEFSEKLEHVFATNPINSTPRNLLKGKKMKTYTLQWFICINNYKIIIHNSSKVEIIQCPLADQWINTMWYIQSME